MKKTGLLLLLLAVSPTAFSQTKTSAAGAGGNTAPASASGWSAAALPPVQVVTLGNSVVTLTGPWKFSPGDSPWVNGSPAWAQPGYDDSRWATMDMTPKAGSTNLMLGTSGYVPGWTKRGYPTLDGYAWYRLRVRVTDPGQPLWLKMPDGFDDAYQIYANGRYVGQFGGFSNHHITLYPAQPASFALPSPGPDGELDVAVRIYMSPATPFNNPDVGGMHGPPALGLASTVHLLQAAEDDTNLHRLFGPFLQTFLFLLIAPLVLWAWLKSREERAWMWLFLAVTCSILIGILVVVASVTTRMTIGSYALFNQVFLASLVLPLWTMFWWDWFGLREKRWIPRVVWLFTAVEMLTVFLLDSPSMGLSLVPLPALHWFNAASLWCEAAVGLLLLVVLVEGFRRDRTEALLAALPILLLEFTYLFSTYLLATFDIPNTFFPFGLGIGVVDIAAVLMVLVIGALALRRFLRTQVRQEVTRKAIAQDLEQAQQLQQRVLIPEPVESPFFTVETVYRPAQTVGGDFFQTLSRPDGTLLVVIGDVSGKGVSAAMLVAVLVGAIRSTAEQSFDPAAMLAMLNRRLIGRSGGHFATCLAAEITPDGTMRIANAGHLPPYLNGNELAIEGSVPLGMVDEAEYPVETFTLQPGDGLIFMTDGVVEATNVARELFGFERAREISGKPAVAIVDEAQRFGQEDDITVVGVEFAGAAATV